MESSWKRLKNFSRYKVYKNGDIFDDKLGRMLKQHVNRDGYRKVTMRHDNTRLRKTMFVHRVVAICFILNPANKETVNHIDGCKENNNVSNLEWNTRSENIQHAWDNNLIKDLESRKNNIRQKQGRPVICVTTGEVFSSSGEAAEVKGLKKNNIHAVCSLKKGFVSAGTSADGDKLIWRFLDEYDKQ